MGTGYRHQSQPEPCLFNGWNSQGISKIESDLWHFEKRRKYIRPTQNQQDCPSARFKKHSKGKNILDLFGGSSSTLIACEKNQPKAP